MNFVKITFNSAKLVISDKKTNCDYIDDVYGYRERPESELISIEDCIKFEPICNMLHVLFGDRPVATLRGNGLRKMSEDIVEITKNGYMKITTINHYIDKNGKMRDISECTQGKKSPYNSHTKINGVKIGDSYFPGMFTWDTIRRRYMYDDDKFNDIVSHIELYSEIDNVSKTKELSAIDCISKIKESKYAKEASEYFKKMEMTSISNYIETGVADFSSFVKYIAKLGSLLINRYVCKKSSFSGEFLFPVTDLQFDMLCAHGGYATYLDGGVAVFEPKKLDIPSYELLNYVEIKNLKKLCE